MRRGAEGSAVACPLVKGRGGGLGRDLLSSRSIVRNSKSVDGVRSCRVSGPPGSRCRPSAAVIEAGTDALSFRSHFLLYAGGRIQPTPFGLVLSRRIHSLGVGCCRKIMARHLGRANPLIESTMTETAPSTPPGRADRLRESPVPEGLPARADGRDANLADAAGGPVHARVPRGPVEGLVPRTLQEPRPGDRGHGHGRRAAGGGCGDPLRRHPPDPGAAGIRPGIRQGRRAGDPQPGPVDAADVDRVRRLDESGPLDYVFQAVRSIRSALEPGARP